jgi:hypothetical protein
MLKEVPKNEGGNPNLPTGSRPEPVVPTLAELGIDKKLSFRAQTIAQLSVEAIDKHIRAATENVAAQWQTDDP